MKKKLTYTPSMMTATPAGWIAWVTATAICFVNRSWTEQTILFKCTILEI